MVATIIKKQKNWNEKLTTTIITLIAENTMTITTTATNKQKQ